MTKKTVDCPICMRSNNASDNFCVYCGGKLNQNLALPQKPTVNAKYIATRAAKIVLIFSIASSLLASIVRGGIGTEFFSSIIYSGFLSFLICWPALFIFFWVMTISDRERNAD